MPFDKNGVELREGDVVVIHCKVKQVFNTDDYNNILLESVEEHYPSNSYTVAILNSKQVEKVGKADGNS